MEVERRCRKQMEFHEVRREVEREMYFWCGLRRGMDHHSGTFETYGEEGALRLCSTGSDFLLFYLDHATPTPDWNTRSARSRWHWVRRATGWTVEPEHRLPVLENIRLLMDVTPAQPQLP
jgi:hypothetical protein